MVLMFGALLRAPMTRLITPLSRGLLAMGISANMVTTAGAFGTVASSIYFFGNGRLFTGTVLITAFVLTDLLDGTMARLSESGASKWGALLDSTLDRICDAAVMGSLLFWLINYHSRLIPVLLTALIASGLVSYIKARAESLDIVCNGGLAERTERLIILLVGTGIAGLGVPWALTIAIWLLAIAAMITVLQRLQIVYQATR
jgi:CDP-diacylglycerol--glycerol-3-phosphate 3-phosphatidyltransferase